MQIAVNTADEKHVLTVAYTCSGVLFLPNYAAIFNDNDSDVFFQRMEYFRAALITTITDLSHMFTQTWLLAQSGQAFMQSETDMSDGTG